MYTPMLGTPVEYHGNQPAYYGHELTITHRAATPAGYRYILANDHGQRVLTNVKPGSVTPCRPGRNRTWTERIEAVRAKAHEIGGQDYADTLAQRLDTVARCAADRAYVDAQREMLALEHITGIITTDDYETRRTHVNATHGPSPASSAA